MRALITGASGFVGRALHRHLMDSGDDVIALARSNGGPDVTDRAAIHRAVTEAHAEVIYHLAAQAHVPTSWDDPIGTLRANVEGTQNVLDAAHLAGDARVLVVTSAEIYGSVSPDELPIAEDAPMRPANPYAASKAAADAVALQAHLGRGQDVLRLRSFNHIGPGQSPDFVCAGLAHRIALAERDGHHDIDVGSLEARRDFSDVRDIVAGYRRSAIQGRSGEAYNVCSGVDRSVQELADTLAGLANHPVRFVVDDALRRPVDTPVVRGDNTRILADTGWKPEIPLQTSLADVLDDARKRLNDETER